MTSATTMNSTTLTAGSLSPALGPTAAPVIIAPRSIEMPGVVAATAARQAAMLFAATSLFCTVPAAAATSIGLSTPLAESNHSTSRREQDDFEDFAQYRGNPWLTQDILRFLVTTPDASIEVIKTFQAIVAATVGKDSVPMTASLFSDPDEPWTKLTLRFSTAIEDIDTRLDLEDRALENIATRGPLSRALQHIVLFFDA